MTTWAAPFARSRVVGARAPAPGLERAEALTPYALQLLAEDTRAAGPRARLVVEIAVPASRGDLTWLRDQLAATVARGTEVAVRRGRPLRPLGPRRP